MKTVLLKNPRCLTTLLAFAFGIALTFSSTTGYAISGPTGSTGYVENSLTAETQEFSKKDQRLMRRNLKKANRARLRSSDQQWSSTTASSDAFAVNGFAIAGFVCGLVGVVSTGGLILGILGVVFSAIGLARIKKGRGGNFGRGLAIAGLVLGIVAIVLQRHLNRVPMSRTAEVLNSLLRYGVCQK